ncbi:MAG: hypothetical protein WC722_01400 [Rhodospirillales bacterium]|jgi:hypothetical protein
MHLRHLAKAALLLSILPFPALAAESLFCLDYAEGACLSPILNGGQVRLDALPANEQGQRVLHLASQQAAKNGQIVFHHWEMAPGTRGGLAEKHRFGGVAPSEPAKAALAAQELGAGSAKASFGFAVKTGGSAYRLHSWRVIHGPGKVAAILADGDGQTQGAAITLEILE